MENSEKNSTLLTEPNKSSSHGLVSLACNVLIPVIILNKLSDKMGALPALFLALAFPIGFGIYDFLRERKFNPLSILGFVNISVTGGLAVLGLGGIWFCLKEAFFPFLIGVFVMISAYRKSPLIRTLLLNPQLLHLDKVDSALKERGKMSEFDHHLKNSTLLLSASFFLSAALNFGLSLRIFKDLDPTLSDEARAVVLNGQIAEMTQWSFLVIMLPSILFLIFILWYMIRGIRKLTGFKLEELLKQ
jgi:hypothetical protein